jgi:hypothetical protein
MGRGGAESGTKWAGWAAIVVGLVLLGVCASNWNEGTTATMGHAFGAYNGGDRGVLRGLGAESLQQSSQTGLEGLAGLFWLGVGAFLVRRAAAAEHRNAGYRDAGYRRREPPPRR